MKHLKTAILLLLAPGLAYSQSQEVSLKALLPERHFEILDNYCLNCHDAVEEEGGINLEDLSFEISADIKTAETWQKVLAVLNEGEMPPKKKKQLSAQEKTDLLSDLSVEMVKARRILSDSGNKIVLRRLNRREYANTIEDLLGFTPDVSSLPPDSGTGSFDTVGANLFFSSDQFEQYRKTAEKALKAVFGLEEAKQPLHLRGDPEFDFFKMHKDFLVSRLEGRYNGMLFLQSESQKASRPQRESIHAQEHQEIIDVPQARNKLTRQSYEHQAIHYLNNPLNHTGASLTPFKSNMRTVDTPKIPSSAYGSYKLRIRAGAYLDQPEFRRYLEYGFIHAGSRSKTILGQFGVKGTTKNPSTIEIPIVHAPNTPGVYFVQHRDYKEKSSRYSNHQRLQAENGIGFLPAVWVDYIEIEGKQTWPPAAHSFLLERKKKESPIAHAKRSIENFSSGAFRGRAMAPKFLNALVDRYQNKLNTGETEIDVLIDTYALVLSSPSFLYMIESAEEEGNTPLTDRELAVRLSYFLWSCPPDNELLTLADEGKLSNPQVLDKQIDRLLADERSHQFIEAFTHQWLDMPRLDMFEFDSKYHPTFDESTRRSARQEVYSTIDYIIKNELPLQTLLKADFAMLNDVLGLHYEIKDGRSRITGPEFRPVAIPKNKPRGGLLGMAATHIMGSDGQRTSPVERGVWVLRHLLNDPPPPAPANVPMLSRIEETSSARDLQKLHQEEPQCAQCHRKIDPIGYGLEHFDAAGLWRNQEVVKKYNGRTLIEEQVFEILSEGHLSSGETFNGFYELRDAIAGREHDFAKGFTEHLISYALGRPFSFSDEQLAHDICVSAAKQDNRIPAFIHALIHSKAFRTK